MIAMSTKRVYQLLLITLTAIGVFGSFIAHGLAYSVPSLMQQTGELSPAGFSYSDQITGHESQITAWVANQGTTYVQGVEAAFYLGDPRTGGERLGTIQTISGIHAGESAIVHLDWIPQESGTVTIYLWIDPNNLITESNEIDNLTWLHIAVRDLGVDLQLPYYALQTDYDLVVGRASTVSVRVENQGELLARDVVVQLFEGDPRQGGQAIGGRATIAELPPQGSQVQQWSWQPNGIGPVVLYAIADPDNVIAELDETNNIVSRTVTVRAPYIDLLIPDYSLQMAEQLIVNHPTEVSIDIVNRGEQTATNVEIRFYAGNPAVDGVQVGTTEVITEVVPNVNRAVYFTWEPTQLGIMDFYITVDGNNIIPETNEANNVISRTVEIREANLTRYVNSSAVTSGDGRSPERAFKTIGEAIDDVLSGDTIRVAAGSYAEELHIPTGVHLLGDDYTTTTITGNSSNRSIITLEASAAIAHFTIVGQPAAYTRNMIEIRGDYVTVSNNRITQSQYNAININCAANTQCTGPITVTHNIIDHSLYAGIQVIEAPMTTIRHNTIVSNSVGIAMQGNFPTLIENNIIVLNRSYGISAPRANGETGANDKIVARYNNVWGNYQPYAGLQSSAGSLALDPLLRDIATGDYRLFAGSPLVGAGNPSGSDLGALPFIPALAAPTAVQLTADGAYQWQLHWTDQQAVGFYLYVTEENGQFIKQVRLGKVQSHTLRQLIGDRTYKFGVSAFDQRGDESAISQKVSLFVPPLEHGHYEENHPALILSDGWNTIASDTASGGAFYASTTVGSQLQITFRGDSLAFRRNLSPQGGWGQIWIDGQSYGYIPFTFVESRWNVPTIIEGLGSGVHHLIIAVASHPYAEPSSGMVAIDFIEIPSPYTPTLAQQQAVERVNWHRSLAGLPKTIGVQSIHLGAQSHVEFVANNQDHPSVAGLGFHRQDPSLPGFTGIGPSDRARYYGYTGGVGEDGHFVGDPMGSVDGWMATIYHRNLIMCYSCIEMGYGMVNDPRGRFDALNMGSRTYSPPATRLISTYPGENQTSIPRDWNGGEIPDPLPNKPKPVGYPVSIHIAQPAYNLVFASDASTTGQFAFAPQMARSSQWKITTAELRDTNRQLVSTYLLEQNTDPAQFLGPDNAFLVPQAPLQENATYYAHFAGVDSKGQPFDKRWSFATGATVEAPTLQVRAWSDQRTTATTGEITFFLRLNNHSPYAAEQVRVIVGPPQNDAIVVGSISATAGQVQEGAQFTVALDNFVSQATLDIQYRVKISEPGPEALVVTVPVNVMWHSGSATLQQMAIVNGWELYLPVVAR